MTHSRTQLHIPGGVNMATTKKPSRPVIKRTEEQDIAFHRAGGRWDQRGFCMHWITRLAEIRTEVTKAKAKMTRHRAEIENLIRENDSPRSLDWAFRSYGNAYADYEYQRTQRLREIRSSLKSIRANCLPLP